MHAAARTILGLLTVLVAAEDPERANLSLPAVSSGAEKTWRDRSERIVVNLTADGRVLFAPRTEEAAARDLQRMSLYRLGAELTTTKTWYHYKQVERGQSGYEADRTSRLKVLLRVDRDAPWQHFACIRNALCDVGYCHLAFAVKSGGKEMRVDFRMPKRGRVRKSSRRGVELTVDVLADGHFRFGEKLLLSPAELSGALKAELEARRKGSPDWIRAIVRAQETVSFGRVVAAVEQLRKREVTRIYMGLRPCPIEREARKAETMPRPSENSELKPAPAAREVEGGGDIYVGRGGR